MPELSYGEKIVRKSSSPTVPADVKEAKRLCAELIDYCYDMTPEKPDTVLLREEERLFGNAATAFEEGCMWLVKALTVKQQ